MSKADYSVAVLTASDAGFAGEREDKSGPAIQEIVRQAGFTIADTALLPDEQDILSEKMLAWSNSGSVHLIVTTGGTGLSPRDCMPEATLRIADRLVPGIPEAVRAYSMQITNKAMLTRGISAICGNTLIINLPGSPKAVTESLECLLPVLEHALDTLNNNTSNCARQ